MADSDLRTLERESLTDPAAALRLRAARIRHGLDPMPALTPTYAVLDPLHLAALSKTVERVARVAAKRGGIPPCLAVAPEPRWVERARPDGSTAMIRLRDVTILGDVPDTGAWRFCARLDHSLLPDRTTATMILRHPTADPALVPETRLEGYRARGPYCDHCDAQRRRNETYVVHNVDTGETSQVGSSCLEAYLGADPLRSLHAFNDLATMTALAVQHAALNDTPPEACGAPLAPFLAYSVDGNTPRVAWLNASVDQATGPAPASHERAATVLAEAQRVMVPALREEQRRERLRLLDPASPLPDWPEGVERLSERWHNVSTIVAAGVVSEADAPLAATLVQWHERRQSRAERTRLADPLLAAEHMARALASLTVPLPVDSRALAQGRLSLDPLSLARALLAPNGQGAALRLAAQAVVDAAAAASGQEEPEETPVGPGPYLAAVGSDVDVVATARRVRPYRSGAGHVVVLSHVGPDRVARTALVFASGAAAPCAEGDRVRLRGRVQRQQTSEYDGTRETVVSDATMTVLA